MDVRWWVTPAEPRWKHALFTGVGTGVLMLIAMPLWSGDGAAVPSWVAAGLGALVSSTLAKLWMERGR